LASGHLIHVDLHTLDLFSFRLAHLLERRRRLFGHLVWLPLAGDRKSNWHPISREEDGRAVNRQGGAFADAAARVEERHGAVGWRLGRSAVRGRVVGESEPVEEAILVAVHAVPRALQ
jgi:hypothetical protein